MVVQNLYARNQLGIGSYKEKSIWVFLFWSEIEFVKLVTTGMILHYLRSIYDKTYK